MKLPRLLPLSLLLPLALCAADTPRYLDPKLPVEARLDDLLPRLTLEEKVALVHADTKFTNPGVPRLGIPPMWLSDGPHGVREEISRDSWKPAGWSNDFSTALPAGIALAATWNPELAAAYGGVIANEARQRNKHVMLGPGVNLMRSPLCGRNFEYYGEDPWLAGRLAVANIRALQAGEVAACVKHFALNNQEEQRNSIDVAVDERTLRELYLPAFEAAVKEGGALTVMGAYNKFRGQWACHNEYLLNQILKQEWGFTGLVISDWNGVHDTKQAALHGMDLEMGTEKKAYDDYYLAKPYREGLQRGEFPMAGLDVKVRRNLRVLLTIKAVDGRSPGAINTKAHQATARRVAEEGLVLLKNSGALLPLDVAKVSRIAVIGDNAVRLQTHGGWSSEIKAFYEISPLAGITALVGPRADITYSAGYRAPRGVRSSTIDAAGVAKLEAELNQQLDPASLIERAVAAAKLADVAIIVGGLNHETNQDCEGSDRKALELPYNQAELIARVAAANPRTIVVIVGGSPVAMDPWLEQVPAVVQAWYGGMEAGNAIAGALFGDVNPSGKLPCTFPRRLADSPAHASGDAKHWPGVNGAVQYDEGLLIGYRWFDAKRIEPLFPFGFGLSYTTFAYANLRVVPGKDGGPQGVSVECDITNTGTRAGAEVAQVYVEDKQCSVPRPVRELKGFAKVALQPGETKRVSIPLPARAFAFYDVAQKSWVAEAGEFAIHVGASSRDLRQTAAFTLPATKVVP